jgi:hypothetical protein
MVEIYISKVFCKLIRYQKANKNINKWKGCGFMSSHFIFTCKYCDSHELSVVWHEDLTSYCREELICFDDCDDVGKLAAVIRYKKIDRYKCWGPLDEDHRFIKEEDELIETYEDKDDEKICEDCHKASEKEDWFYYEESDDFDDANGEIEYYVYCAGCGREIEFGWSHPDRGGRVWPVECEDFNPWKSWPEPRFKESWTKKNWI